MKIILMLCIAASLFACGNRDSVHEAKQQNNMTEGIMPINEEDADFVVEATNGSLTEIEAGKLAFDRTQNPEVKDFANTMIDDHTQMIRELKTFADDKHLAVPDSVSNSNRSKIDELNKRSGKEFDREYMKWMVDDHDKDVAAFTKMSNEAKDSSVKSLARYNLPILLKHQQRAHAIYDRLK